MELIINTQRTDGVTIIYHNLKYAIKVYENGNFRIFQVAPYQFLHVHKNYSFAKLNSKSIKLIQVLMSKNYASYQSQAVLKKAKDKIEKGEMILKNIHLERLYKKKKRAMKRPL